MQLAKKKFLCTQATQNKLMVLKSFMEQFGDGSHLMDEFKKHRSMKKMKICN
jgi:hypothetical protein